MYIFLNFDEYHEIYRRYFRDHAGLFLRVGTILPDCLEKLC